MTALMKTLRVATYNVNGIKARLPNLLEWLANESPDVVCLQELKAVDSAFPIGEIRDTGYGAIWLGQSAWNGVAILAKGTDPIERRRGLSGRPSDNQSRYIEATIEGLIVGCLYLPNGNPQPGPKFKYKLDWFRRLNRYAAELYANSDPVILAGDFNVIPTDEDIYNTRSWLKDALLQPESRKCFQKLLEQGWTDSLRVRHPDERIYTYWDYFRNHWQTDSGLRIDHLLLNATASKYLVDAGVDKWVRGKPHASDHAPTWITLGSSSTKSRSSKASSQPKASRSSSRPKKRTSPALPSLDTIEPQLATLVESPPSEAGYVYEIKFDGYRALSRVQDGKVSIRSRNGLDWSKTFPVIAEHLAVLKIDNAILDGEICFVDEGGRTRFQGLQNAMGTRGHQRVAKDDSLVYFIFDILWLNGRDLRSEPLSERKTQLSRLMGKGSSVLRYSEHHSGDLRHALTQACGLGLEGLIAKKADAIYEEGRSRHWIKLKCGRRQEFVIAGYVIPEGSRTGFRSLLLGLREKDGSLRYVGKVGTGFNDDSLRSISKELKTRAAKSPSVENPPREKGLRWVRPDLVCEVSFTEMTKDGSLRHPSFQGLRQDKPSTDVTKENPAPIKPKTSKQARRRGSAVERVAGINISHPDRIVDEQSKLTKVDLARYYEIVADDFLRYAEDRPMALVRCPDGDAHQCFFQKNAMQGLSTNIRRGKAAGQGILSVDSSEGLIELVQFNAMEFHGWGASRRNVTRPDWVIFDLDPDASLAFSVVVEAALEIKDALSRLGLESFVKTTGGKGLHVTVPITPRKGWDEVKSFSRAIAESLAFQRPDRYVATMSIAKRKGKIFIDYLRNGEGATAVLPYSSRARAGATVAVPVDWKNLRNIDPKDFRVGNVGQWKSKRRADPWKAFLSTKQFLPDLIDR